MARADTPAAPAGSQIRAASGINVLLGLWLIVAAFVVAVSPAAYWNDLLIGIVVLVLAAARVSRPTVGTRPASWVNAAIGVWLIAAPFVLGYVANQEMWNDVIVGVLILVFGAWSASLPRETAASGAPRGGRDTTATSDTRRKER